MQCTKHMNCNVMQCDILSQVAHKPNEAPESNMNMYPPSTPSQSYYAMSSVVDEAVQNVTEALKANGMWENTLLVFSSDNGEESDGDQRKHYL